MDKIDFVLPWVDGSDSAWIKQRNEYLGIKNDQTQISGLGKSAVLVQRC